MAAFTRGSPRASIAMLHSLSKPIERLLKFAEPTLHSSSSTTITLLCTFSTLGNSSPGTYGYMRR
jgi:hypothetical protein